MLASQRRVFDDPSKSGNDIRWVFSDNGFMLPAAHWSFHPKNTCRLVGQLIVMGHLGLSVIAQDFPGDMPLSKVLLPDQGWERAADGFQFTDGACSDAEGHFYFSGRRGDENAIYRIHHAHGLEVFIADAPGVSGLAFGPDGRLYGCRWSQNEVIVFDEQHKMVVLAKDTHANDLALHAQGHLYYTAQRGVVWLDPHKQWHAQLVSEDLATPNGISLNPDGGMLLVSEYGGEHVWAFTTDLDQGPKHGDTYMTMRHPNDETPCRGDGMTVDEEGRCYVTTALGLQMFDATGRISGVMTSPAKGLNNVAFAGSRRDHLYVTCSNGIYKRQTKTRGIWPFQPSAQTP